MKILVSMWERSISHDRDYINFKPIQKMPQITEEYITYFYQIVQNILVIIL